MTNIEPIKPCRTLQKPTILDTVVPSPGESQHAHVDYALKIDNFGDVDTVKFMGSKKARRCWYLARYAWRHQAWCGQIHFPFLDFLAGLARKLALGFCFWDLKAFPLPSSSSSSVSSVFPADPSLPFTSARKPPEGRHAGKTKALSSGCSNIEASKDSHLGFMKGPIQEQTYLAIE